MSFLKNLAVTLFSFFFFLALASFGFAFTLKSTALNPDFISAELSHLEISALVEETIQTDNSTEMAQLNEAAKAALAKLDPDIKQQADAAIHSIYDYLLDKTDDPRLALILRETFLSPAFITPLLNSIDIAPLAGAYIEQLLAQNIPFELPGLDAYVNDVLTKAEPTLKEMAVAVSGPASDYILRIIQQEQALASLEQIEDARKTPLLNVLTSSLPSELAIIPPELTQGYLELAYAGFTQELNNAILDPALQANVTSGIAEAEKGLAEAKPYIRYFQQGYIWLLVFMALMVMGIILLIRNVKDIAHRLGIPLLTYGALEYGGILVTKYLMSSGRLNMPTEIPAPLQVWLTQLTFDIMRPLEILSLSLLIIGLALTVVSFLYKHDQELKWS